MWRTFGSRMVRRDTWITALVVGTLINVYGQILVPVLRGSGGPFIELRASFVEAPGLALLSVLVGYAFPLSVSALSAARTQHEHRAATSLARFPDFKPDPVFRATPNGAVVEAGAPTRVMFERHGVTTAQQIVGEEAWSRITERIARDGVLDRPEVVFVEQDARWYSVAASAGPDGINVYLSVVPSGGGTASEPLQAGGVP